LVENSCSLRPVSLRKERRYTRSSALGVLWCWILLSALQVAPPVAADIVIDGVLDEPEWGDAQVFDNFLTTEPLTSEPAKYRTEVRLFTNQSGIYIGFTNHQPASVKRVHRQFPRDAWPESDRNNIAIDFDGTSLSGYDFTLGSANTQTDGAYSANGWSADWDGTWYSQTSANKDY
jgi:hypothetical protein